MDANGKIRELPVFCSWHPRYFGEDFQMAGPPPADGEPISHGICHACNRLFYEEEGIPPPGGTDFD